MITDLTSPKWQLDDRSAARFLVETGLSSDSYWESWNIVGFQFFVRYPLYPSLRPWETDSGRWMGLVTGEKLGGYAGVSFSPGNESESPHYHIGTPAGKLSLKLVAAMKKAVRAEEKAEKISDEQIAVVFKNRNLLIDQLRVSEELKKEVRHD